MEAACVDHSPRALLHLDSRRSLALPSLARARVDLRNECADLCRALMERSLDRLRRDAIFMALAVAALLSAVAPASIRADAKEPALPPMPPAELLACGAEPQTPPLPTQDWSTMAKAMQVQGERDKIVLTYILALRAWGSDCAGKVKELKSWRLQAPSSPAKAN